MYEVTSPVGVSRGVSIFCVQVHFVVCGSGVIGPGEVSLLCASGLLGGSCESTSPGVGWD